MPAPKTLSREYRIYLAIWRKAQREIATAKLSPVVIHASNFSTALAIRQGMYRAIRPYREGHAIDEELRLASENFVISCIAKEDKSSVHTLTLKQRSTLSELEREILALGIDDADLLTLEEKLAQASLGEFLSSPTGPAVEFMPKRSTPFYTRED